ncbi:MAG: hypothetical protein DRP76_00220 [Candidatus Omnitrophota bacterium]|nr:MAG: hypothetical protein DRP76_00220 [Candidatus Omnitrophota bacterium]
MSIEILSRKAINLLRKAKDNFGSLVFIWQGDKESLVVLDLAYKAFFGGIPFFTINFAEDISSKESFLKKVKSAYRVDFISLKGRDGFLQFVDRRNIQAFIFSYCKEKLDITYKKKCLFRRNQEFSLKPKNISFVWEWVSSLNKEIIFPLADWGEIDVYRFIRENNLFLPEGERFPEEVLNNSSVNGREEKEQVIKRLRDLGYM